MTARKDTRWITTCQSLLRKALGWIGKRIKRHKVRIKLSHCLWACSLEALLSGLYFGRAL